MGYLGNPFEFSIKEYDGSHVSCVTQNNSSESQNPEDI